MTLEDYLVLALTVLGSISAISHALVPLVKLTATDKDDLFLAKVNLVLSKVQSVFSSLAAPKKS